MIAESLKIRLDSCQELPSLPAVAIKIIEIANDPNADMASVCQYISLDPVLAAKLIRTANSPIYKSRRSATNIRQAVSILGMHTVIVIALSFSLANSLMKTTLPNQSPVFDSNFFWRRSIATALAGVALGEKLGVKFLDDLFLASLIQEIGILAFWVIMPDEYSKIFQSSPDHDALLIAEREAFGAGHDELGYSLLHKWGIPDYIALSCINSHCAPEPKSFGPTLQACLAVSRYLADYFLVPKDSQMMNLNKAAQDWLGLEASTLIDVIKIMEEELSAVEDLFEITIHQPSEVNQILAEAKELLLLYSLSNMQVLENKSKRDGLTGAYNRAYFDETLQLEFQVAQQNNLPLTIAIFDIDHFKRINDTYGHVAGDAVLIAMVELIKKRIRQDDTLSRYGGEEFALILPGTPLAAAKGLIIRLKNAIAEIVHQIDDGDSITITVSIGIAAFLEHAAHMRCAVDLLHAADAALYTAKNAGRNQIKEWNLQ